MDINFGYLRLIRAIGLSILPNLRVYDKRSFILNAETPCNTLGNLHILYGSFLPGLQIVATK